MENKLYPQLPLDRLVDIFDSQRKPVKKADRKFGPYPYYGASGIADYVDSYIFDGEYLLLAEDGENLKTQNTPIAFMAKGKFWVNNHAHILQGNEKNNTRFLCYALQIADVKSYLSGSTRPKLTQGDMKRIPVFAPLLTEQKAIAHILGSLDDKIELNRRMNETLEAMAQALFKSWFVDFDPVIDNALAAGNEIPEELKERANIREALGDARKPLPDEIQNLFPSEFEHTEEMGWIPKGWKVFQIGELLELAYGKALSAKNREPGPFPVYGSGGMGGYHKESLVKGPGIIVGRKGTVGSVFWEDDDFFPIDTVFFVKLLQDIPLYWIYQRLSLMNIASLGADSAVPGVNRNAVHAKRWVVPDSNVFKKYWDLFEAKVEKLRELKLQSRILSNLRDTLLPQLLSGEIRIPEAEKLVDDLERNGGGNGKS